MLYSLGTAPYANIKVINYAEVFKEIISPLFCYGVLTLIHQYVNSFYWLLTFANMYGVAL